MTTGLILPVLPENLDSLHKHEEETRAKAILHIRADAKLEEHLTLIQDCLNMVYDIVTVYKNQSDDELTIQYLGIRLFNTIVSSIALMLAGYYQNSLTLQRDIVETGFLLDFFASDPVQIKAWKSASEEERLRVFKPRTIREALDRKSQTKGRKRGQIYKNLCEYAAHPTYRGFKLVAPKGLGKIGPFFDEKYLDACLGELVLRIPYFILVYIGHFKNLPQEFTRTTAEFLVKLKKWYEKYLKLDFKDVDTDSIEKLLELL